MRLRMVFGASINRFFLPSTFKIDEDGITASYPLRSMRLKWKDLRRFLVGEQGGLLSRRARSSSMDVFTGMLKSVVFGITIAAVGCTQGLLTRGGATGVGQAARRSVVVTFLLVIILGYYLSWSFLS